MTLCCWWEKETSRCMCRLLSPFGMVLWLIHCVQNTAVSLNAIHFNILAHPCFRACKVKFYMDDIIQTRNKMKDHKIVYPDQCIRIIDNRLDQIETLSLSLSLSPPLFPWTIKYQDISFKFSNIVKSTPRIGSQTLERLKLSYAYIMIKLKEKQNFQIGIRIYCQRKQIGPIGYVICNIQIMQVNHHLGQ